MRPFSITLPVTILAACFGLWGCSPAEQAAPEPSSETASANTDIENHSRIETPTIDEHSFANSNEVRTPHLHLNLAVDFDAKVLSGYVEFELEYLNENANTLVLDTEMLNIARAEAYTNGEWAHTEFTLGERDVILGTPLSVTLPVGAEKVRVHYSSSPEATGLDWVAPEGTAGGEYPFLYSQSQPHYARTWIPIQDTPTERLTFSAELRTPPELIGLMGANNPPNPERTGVYQFESRQKIPSYLMAIAVGDLEFHALNERMAIYAEPSILQSAVAEFGYTTDMMDVTEELFGPFAWDRYDQLVLPPSFPFGGMENPQLAFLTPTVIAGDQSLVSLIAHELAHSWSGNLVTNATWRDLWLNEGFTSYVENRIMEAVYGEERALMERMLDAQSLDAALPSLSERQQVLHIELAQRDPDSSFTAVPYTKAQQFLFFLEDRFGRETFDAFVRQYFADFAFQSLTTEQFQDYMERELVQPNPGKVSRTEIMQWLYAPGLPDNSPRPEVAAFERVAEAQARWFAGEPIDIRAWSIHERLYFLTNLPEDVSHAQLERMDKEFHLTNTQNNSVLSHWLVIAIQHDYQPAMPRVEEMLTSMGRLAYIRSVYAALAATPEGLEKARQIYVKAKPGYHVLTRDQIEDVLGL
ncbi:aminopeptidase [Aliidiomarina shirensis]|uniref:Aminopeptidase N n=1 Tax=Aliidiomarina shirensis TaxID=1048642 RepID=A0A432WQC0_9GAMM|nr:M1 family metallopeptidase [Aliidiomarina shirensis]RUO36006.1 aminopeptidase [Aliidiomarina shirensis]